MIKRDKRKWLQPDAAELDWDSHYRRESERWKGQYYAEHQRIVDLALDHSPKLDASNEDGLPGLGRSISYSSDKQPQFSCNGKGCAYLWPCPTYLWATGSVPFVVRIEPKVPSRPNADTSTPGGEAAQGDGDV